MTTTATQLINFIKGLESQLKQTRKLTDFEQYCKLNKDAFEIIPDDGYIKPYFDIDITVNEGDMKNSDDRAEKSRRLLNIYLHHLSKYFFKKTYISPIFCIATSHKETKLSYHVTITNINTTKQAIYEYYEEINEQIKQEELSDIYESLFEPVPRYGPNGIIFRENKGFAQYRIKTYIPYEKLEDVLFDFNVYKQRGSQQKMRCVHCVKDSEPNRPLKILPKHVFDNFFHTTENAFLYFDHMDLKVSDKFEDMLISVTDPTNEVYPISAEISNEPVLPLQQTVTPPAASTPPVSTPKASTVVTQTDTTADEMFVNLAIEKGLMTQYATDYGSWRDVGFTLKNTFSDEKGWELFDKFSRLAGNKYSEMDYIENRDKWDSWKSKGEVANPIGMGSLIRKLKETHKDEVAGIQKEIKSYQKKADTRKKSAILKQQESEDPIIEMDPTKLDNFDGDYMNSFKSSYKNQKQYMEHFISKVLRPEPQYIYMESSKDLGKAACIFSEANITAAFKHIRTEKVVNEDGDVKEVAFTSLWLNDPEIKCFNKLDFIPYNGFREEQTNKQVYNLFTGYNPKILTPYNKDKKDIILKPFKDLWLELCGGNPEHFKYVYNFLAHIIQKPNEKIPICIIIKGKQGTGKNVGLKAFGNIIGEDHFISSANPNDFFGEYAEGFYHKLLVNMNECEGKDTFDFEGKIKAFISEDTITVNAKHVRPSHVRNVARTIIFTNKPNPVPIDVKTSDRRYGVLQTTDKFLDKKYGTKFWVKLVEHFNKPEFIACLYDDLNTLDIENVDWRTERPITEAYKEMCKLYVPVEALFLEHYMNTFRTINSDSAPIDVETIDSAYTNWFDEMHIKTKDVYDEYSKFCKSNGFSNDKSFQPSISKFNNRLSELEIPKKITKTYGINEMRFTPKTIYDHLVKKKWIARDENDPEIVVEDFAGEDFEFEI